MKWVPRCSKLQIVVDDDGFGPRILQTFRLRGEWAFSPHHQHRCACEVLADAFARVATQNLQRDLWEGP